MLQHCGNDVGLRNGLTLADGKRVVFVCLILKLRQDEFVARDFAKRVKDARVAYAASLELIADHLLALDGKSVRLIVVDGFHIADVSLGGVTVRLL